MDEDIYTIPKISPKEMRQKLRLAPLLIEAENGEKPLKNIMCVFLSRQTT